jgi:hypothetical protein
MGDREYEGLTRRDTLKRGLKLGAVLWVTPVVQVVGMRPAFAQVPSPACTVWYAVKIDPTENTVFPHCVDISGQNNPTGGQCLDVDDVGQPVSPGGCNHIVSSVTGPEGADWTVTLDEGCQFVAGSDRCFSKEGNACFEGTCTYDHATRTLTFHDPAPPSISHVEFAFCCED